MILGYNTNGFAHHELNDALEIIAEAGFYGVALTPDMHHLPFDEFLADAVEHYGLVLEQLDLSCVIESGSRFMLDPRRKHRPTLLAPDARERRLRREFIEDHIDLAQSMQVPIVSIWSGAVESDEAEEALLERLVQECRHLADYAAARRVKLAFEPEPGMLIDTMAKFAALEQQVRHASFGLTLDTGHCVCMGEVPISEHIERWRERLWNVHLDDMKPGVHDHLMFGEGAVDFADVFTALHQIGYQGMASVELSRHSHDAVNAARRSLAFLKQHVPG